MVTMEQRAATGLNMFDAMCGEERLTFGYLGCKVDCHTVENAI